MNTYCGTTWTWISGGDYLCHHGRDGQRKGVRNGPPYPLSSQAVRSGYSGKEAKIYKSNDDDPKTASWRSKESKKVDKKYKKQIRRADKAVTSAKKAYKEAKRSGDESKTIRKRLDLDSAKTTLDTIKAKQLIEKNAVMHMSVSDIKAEKMYVGKKVATSAVLSVGAVPIAAVLRSPNLIVIPRVGNIKTNFRLNELQKRQLKEANKKEKERKEEQKIKDNIESTISFDNDRDNNHQQSSKTPKQTSNDSYKVENGPFAKSVQKSLKETGHISDKALVSALKSDSNAREWFKERAKSAERHYKLETDTSLKAKVKAMRSRGLTYEEIGNRIGEDEEIIYYLINDKE